MAADVATVAREETSAWVQPLGMDIPAHSANREVSGGILHLLIDEQLNVREGALYRHYADQLISESGVEEGSRLSINFDPAYQSLTLNKLLVHRNGRVINHLPTQEIKLIQREEGLDQQLYDGRLDAVMLLEDIRAGDIVEYAYSIRGENPIFEGRFAKSLPTQWSDPVHRLHYRILSPHNRSLTFKSHGEEFAPTVTTTGDTDEYLWDKVDVAPVISDGDLPSWFNPCHWLQVTEYKTWTEVAQWATKLYVVADSMPDALREQVEAIRPVGDQKAKALAALHFVQNKIRYLGVEVGEHSYNPYPIELVLQRRFGDCKDKALLLCALLRHLGLQAYPALVETDCRHTISSWLPTPLAFDHLVVMLTLDGRTYWLDPTRSNQGGMLDQLYFPAFGVALVVKEETVSLTEVVPSGFDASSEDVTESFEFADYKGDAILSVHTIFRGWEADRMRGWLEENSQEAVKKEFLNFYAKSWSKIKSKAAPRFTDNFERNEIICEESYIISDFWQPGHENRHRLYGDFYPHILRHIISEPHTHLRIMPYALTYPKNLVQTIRFTLPDMDGYSSENMEIKDQAFHFAYSAAMNGHFFELHYAYKSLEDHVDASRTPEYLKKIDAMLDKLDYEIWISKSLAEDKPVVGPPSQPVVASPYQRPIVLTLVAVAPFLFVGIAWLAWSWRTLHRYQRSIAGRSESENPLHRCVLCSRTEQSDPELDFRVAYDGEEYCRTHLPKRS